jgi:hypothetical protein
MLPSTGWTVASKGGYVRRIRNHRTGHGRRGRTIVAALVLAAAAVMAVPSAAATRDNGVKPNTVGMLDCNGRSTSQTRVYAPGVACADPRMFEDGHPARFEDNGAYVGHDEPIIKFNRAAAGPRHDPLVRALQFAVVQHVDVRRPFVAAHALHSTQRLERADASAHLRPWWRR